MWTILFGLCVWSVVGGVFCYGFLAWYEGGKPRLRIENFSKEELKFFYKEEAHRAKIPDYIMRSSIKGGLAVGVLWLIYRSI